MEGSIRGKLDFSVSICVYGKDNPMHFDVALSSIIHQSVRPTEIVLAVDGPIPKGIENVIDKYGEISGEKKVTFKVIRLEKNMGHGEARRISFDNCSCDYVAIMDADDIAVHERFEKQIQFLEKHPETTVVGGYITEFISTDSEQDTSQKAGVRVVPETDMEIKEYLKKRCPMNQVTVMFNKVDVTSVGGYIDWYCEEDYYLWIRLALAGKKFANIPETLVNVRVGEEMYQRRGGYRYFRSEAKLQKYMLEKRIIALPRYVINVMERFVVQVLLPNRVRSFVFRKLARS